ncbi:hypothetical protein LTR94_029866, partial [Friedmanniomyces endolithicus]
ALDLGAHDILARPVDPEEMSARVRTQVKRKRYGDFLREKLDYNLEMAITDPLTGLHNRRYMNSQIQALVARATRGGDPVAVLVLDIDHFKAVNDTFGHASGDDVLRTFASVLTANTRGTDAVARLGGEEFAVLYLDVRLAEARAACERIRLQFAAERLALPDGRQVAAT